MGNSVPKTLPFSVYLVFLSLGLAPVIAQKWLGWEVALAEAAAAETAAAEAEAEVAKCYRQHGISAIELHILPPQVAVPCGRADAGQQPYTY